MLNINSYYIIIIECYYLIKFITTIVSNENTTKPTKLLVHSI